MSTISKALETFRVIVSPAWSRELWLEENSIIEMQEPPKSIAQGQKFSDVSSSYYSQGCRIGLEASRYNYRTMRTTVLARLLILQAHRHSNGSLPSHTASETVALFSPKSAHACSFYEMSSSSG
jgi:hypothetical protein